jgi:class 3 adenylate cyclase/CHASE2 domain-containing sensor protein
LCTLRAVKLKTLKRAPVYITAGVVGVFCLVQALHLDFFERLEDLTYDWRVRQALRRSQAVSTNLGFVSISEQTITLVNKGMLERSYGLYWPRHIYGRVANELAAEGAKTIAFDVLFPDLRRDHAPLAISSSGHELEPDEDFAAQIRLAGNVILAAEKTSIPPKLFRTNAMALGDITVNDDLDGVLRRTRAFRIYRKWHWAFETVESDPDYAVDLNNVRVEPDRIVLLRPDVLPPISIPLTNGLFDLKDFTDRIPRGMERFDKPYTDERVWDMGIVLAAQELKLDLEHAGVDFAKGRIVLRGPSGVTRVIPVDKDGYFYINWLLAPEDPKLEHEPFEGLLAQYQRRVANSTNPLVNMYADRFKADWKGKLVVIGSEAIANDLTDRGATPLAGNSILVSKHWNVANSIITGEFVHRSTLPVDLALIIVMGLLSLGVTYSFRSYIASGLVLVGCLFYVVAAVQAYSLFQYWMPMVLPVGGGLLVLHACLLAYLVFFEQLERHRLKAVFTKMVSPDVVNEVLKTEKLSLSGARRNVTVFFADIRGFTEMTDVNLEKAAEYVKEKSLTGEAAEAIFDRQSQETLATVNSYLKVIAETVLKHNGTVDKFIGDCVMAFWGAPIPNARHALACVRAAIDVQRAVYRLNLEREAENRRLEAENMKLAAEGQPLRQLLPVLSIGSGVNTGVVTVGLMGSDDMVNYTVFGRDVNLASRLESYSGRGRIIISEATLAEIIQDDPSLALSCVELPAVNLKGFRTAIPVYEVPWREAGETAPNIGGPASTAATGEGNTSFFGNAGPASG